ncbi:MAG: transposase [Candidatus Promineifilaceae bacterium]
MTAALVEVGQFCPNERCPRYGDIENGQMIRFGRTAKGTQRFRCRVCGQTFVETRGTLFYGKHTPRQDILETLALLAEGVRISSLSRAKGFKVDTILGWLRQAARQAEQVDAALLNNYQVSRAQIDALWAYVGHNGQKSA